MSPRRALLPLLAPLVATILSLSAVPTLGWAAQSAPPTLAARARQTLPHDPDAFTQGLVFHNGEFMESTGLYRQSTLRRVDPETGGVLALSRLPGRLFGEGLALCPPRPGAAPRLVQLTWREGLILTYDAHSLRQTSTHPLRGEGWGLAWDGSRLLLSDGSDTIRLLAPGDFAETGRLRVREGQTPVRELNELEWMEGWLLANVLGQDRIAVIDPETGQVAAWLDLAPLRRELGPRSEAANGMAFDPRTRTLFVTGKRWNKLFALEPPALPAHPQRR